MIFRLIIVLILSLDIALGYSQEDVTIAYFIPGMGTDYRIFEGLEFDSTVLRKETIKWVDYESCDGLSDYAKELTFQIDTTKEFILVGVSMGGMLAVEMLEFVTPKQLILISSAKSNSEIPKKYKWARYSGAYKLITDNQLKRISNSKSAFKDVKDTSDVELYQDMLLTCGADFLKWQIRAITSWERSETAFSVPVYHIHGGRDKILPIRKIKYDCLIQNGTHKMIVNYRKRIESLILEIIKTTANNGYTPC
jgi:surfactin synthase thioesterase subunit